MQQKKILILYVASDIYGHKLVIPSSARDDVLFKEEVMNNILLKLFKLSSSVTLRNRIIMAPMTRSFSKDDNTPTELMRDYYARRAEAGLIITEGTIISRDATGYLNVPGIYSEKHIQAWKKITDAVHAKGGKIFCQIWHVGRVSHPYFLDGELPISPSATQMHERIRRMDGLHYGKSRAASVEEIHAMVENFRQAAINARAAGFDGVEIHGANGYLIDQFLHYHTNFRDDEYGGNANNMIRFPLEVVNAVCDAIGTDCVGLRLSPAGYLNEVVSDPRDAEVFEKLLSAVNKKSLAYVHTGTFDDTTRHDELNGMTMTQFLRSHYQGNLIANGGYALDQAAKDIVQKHYDLIAIGKPFIANPDLVTRYREQQPLNDYNVDMLKKLY